MVVFGNVALTVLLKVKRTTGRDVVDEDVVVNAVVVVVEVVVVTGTSPTIWLLNEKLNAF